MRRRVWAARVVGIAALGASLLAAPASAEPVDPGPGWDIQVAADSVPRGGSVEVAGSCSTDDEVEIDVFHRGSFFPATSRSVDSRYLGQPLFTLAPFSAPVDATGSFSGTIDLPDGAVPGEYWARGVCEGGEISDWGAVFTVAGSDPRPTFSDLDGQSQHLDPIRSLAASEVTLGCEPGNFCPTDDISRAQFASLLHRLLADDLGGSRVQFDDVASGSVHGRAIEELAGTGIIRGCDDDAFCPDEPIRRDQAASLLARALGVEAADEAPRFQDVAHGSVHADAIAVVDGERIMRGCRGNSFCPGDNISRAQSASVLARGFGEHINQG